MGLASANTGCIPTELRSCFFSLKTLVFPVDEFGD
jgi:hypothetical protein